MDSLRRAALVALEALEEMDFDDPELNQESLSKQAITALRSALALPEQKPVAWMYSQIKYDGTHRICPLLIWQPEHMDTMSKQRGANAIPLYAQPQQRYPLTDDEISTLSCTMVKGDKSVNWVCRAVEAAHGIGGLDE